MTIIQRQRFIKQLENIRYRTIIEYIIYFNNQYQNQIR